jgi:hypothetical protein
MCNDEIIFHSVRYKWPNIAFEWYLQIVCSPSATLNLQVARVGSATRLCWQPPYSRDVIIFSQVRNCSSFLLLFFFSSPSELIDLECFFWHPSRNRIPTEIVQISLFAVHALLWGVPVVDGFDNNFVAFARSKLYPSLSSPLSSQVGAVIEIGGGNCPPSMYPMLAGVAQSKTQVMLEYTEAASVYRLSLSTFISLQSRELPKLNSIHEV